MKRYLSIVLFCFILYAALPAQALSQMEPGKALFKIRSSAKASMNLQANTCGIYSIDQKLKSFGARELKQHFSFNPAKANAQLPDLSLIIEISFDERLDPVSIASALASDPAVEYAEPIYIDTAFDVPNDPNYPSSLYFASLFAEEAWAIHKGENGSVPIIIAAVDTGVNWKHPDLAQNIWQNIGEDANGNGYTMYHNGSAWVYDPGDLNGIDDDGNGFTDDLIGWDFMQNNLGDMHYDPFESSGHGTNVSGIINARTNNGIGVASLAWNLILMPISCSFPGSSSIFRGYNAIIYAAENGAHIINCSWGGTSASSASQDAINYAWGLGSVIIAAAGNSNNSTPIYPAAYQNVVAVAALQNDGTKSSVSNFGSYVDLGAPNTTVGTTVGSGYGTVSGATSYASPIAASLAGLIKSYHPTWTNAEVVSQLIATCDNIDAMNPGKENMLGQGKLNALRALTDVNPSVDAELRLALHELRPSTDANANRALEPGETFSLNLSIRNYSWDVSSNAVSYTLYSSDPFVSIINNNHIGSIGADGIAELNNVFLVQVSPTATSKFVNFTLNISADKSIVSGASISFQILINAGGIFVWEGVASGRDMSGVFFRNRLNALGYQNTYGSTFPPSLLGFDAVFLSFGMVGSNIVRFNKYSMYEALKQYLEAGGKLYIEGCDVVGFDMSTYLPNAEGSLSAHEVLWPLLGIANADDGTTKAVNHLHGLQGWITYPIQFYASNQTKNDYIDTFVPMSAAYSALIESDYGIVAIEAMGSYGQRSFVSSYPLAELIDTDVSNSRNALLGRILDFFLSPAPALPQISQIPVLNELLLPKYMASDAGEKLIYTFRYKLENLLPNSTYYYVNTAVKAVDSPLYGGQGISVYASLDTHFRRQNNPDPWDNANCGSFQTDANGSYSGWFLLEANAGSHFNPGTELFMRIRLNDGIGGNKASHFLTGSTSVKTLYFGQDPVSDQGTAILGHSYASDKSMLMLYDNIAGSGRPISGSHVEISGLSFVEAGFPEFYTDFVANQSGAWAAVIPNHVNAKNFPGIIRIEARSLETGNLTAFSTDDDGIWPGGANTQNPSGGTVSPLFITPDDATLPLMLSFFGAVTQPSGIVELRWISITESNLSGYYVLGSDIENLDSARIISPLIEASNTSTTSNYFFADPSPLLLGRRYYYLMVLENNAETHYHGPIIANALSEDDVDNPPVNLRTAISAVYPNPFNPLTRIDFTIGSHGMISMEIYNLKGQRVKTLLNTHLEPGYHHTMWNAEDKDGKKCGSGIYTLVLRNGESTQTRKLILMK